MKQFLDSDYWVTEDGKIWSNKTKRFLSPSPNNKGYLTTTIKHKGELHKMIHRIVAITYLGEGEGVVHHKDNIRDNNHYTNLEWTTQKRNTHLSYETLPPTRNFINCQLLHKGEIIGEFKTIVDACRYFEKELGGKFSVLRRFYKSGDYEIKKV